jgi:hypothetical protein
MDTNQIDRALRSNATTRTQFRGVYPANQIPLYVLRNTRNYPHSLAINTDPSQREGEHWVALHITGPERAEYFDSFGQPPPPSIAWHLDRFPGRIIRNEKPLQSHRSEACGHHVLHFLMERARGRSLTSIVKGLTRPKSTPDQVARAYVRYHFKGHI